MQSFGLYTAVHCTVYSDGTVFTPKPSQSKLAFQARSQFSGCQFQLNYCKFALGYC